MDETVYINAAEAARLATSKGYSVSKATVCRWCRQYKLGHQSGGWHNPWRIDKNKFLEFLHGYRNENGIQKDETSRIKENEDRFGSTQRTTKTILSKKIRRGKT